MPWILLSWISSFHQFESERKGFTYKNGRISTSNVNLNREKSVNGTWLVSLILFNVHILLHLNNLNQTKLMDDSSNIRCSWKGADVCVNWSWFGSTDFLCWVKALRSSSPHELSIIVSVGLMLHMSSRTNGNSHLKKHMMQCLYTTASKLIGIS